MKRLHTTRSKLAVSPSGDVPEVSPLARQLAERIVEAVRLRELGQGDHLSVSAFAEEFGVSRSPVRRALDHLARTEIVESIPNRGFFLAVPGRSLGRMDPVAEADDDAPYIRIARDRLLGHLPTRFKEAQLMRRYGISRTRLHRILSRMAREGWVERLPGYGWRFLPVLTSPEAHVQSYQFRLAIEPAAILEPTFENDQAGFRRCRDGQNELLDSDFARISPARIFAAGSEFHETIAACSGNPFFLDALRQQNRLRRLLEYRIAPTETRFRTQCIEHIQLLDLLENGERESAAQLLRRHLLSVENAKSLYHRENKIDRSKIASF